MDIIFIFVLIAGLIIRNKGHKAGNKSNEQLGNIMAGISAFILVILWVYSCRSAMP